MKSKANTSLFLLLLSLFSVSNTAFAQNDCINLIPNPDLEEYNGLPDYYGQWNKAVGWNNVNMFIGFIPQFGSPDYLNVDAPNPDLALPNSVFGTVTPHSGKGLMHFVAWFDFVLGFHEYLSAPLNAPMTPGDTYEVSVWITNGEKNLGGYGTNGLGISFSEDPLIQLGAETITDAVTQWKTSSIFYDKNWQEIKFQFVADKPYKHFTIGNFLRDDQQMVMQFAPPVSSTNSANYFIDDISVKKVISSTQIVTDSKGICPGDSLILTSNNPGQNLIWSTGATTDSIVIYEPGQYSLFSSGNCGNFADSISIAPNYCGKPFEVPNAFTPNGDAANDTFSPVLNENFRLESLRVYNRWGNLVFDSQNGNSAWDGNIDGEPAASDVYAYTLEIRNLVTQLVELRHGDLTLLR